MKTLSALILLAATTAQAGTLVVQRDVYACREREFFERTVQLATQGDKEAFTNKLMSGLMSGQCVMLKRGEPVYLDAVAVMGGLKRVHQVGKPATFWTFTEAVR